MIDDLSKLPIVRRARRKEERFVVPAIKFRDRQRTAKAATECIKLLGSLEAEIQDGGVKLRNSFDGGIGLGPAVWRQSWLIRNSFPPPNFWLPSEQQKLWVVYP
jgi:hypothetical protein